MELFLWNQVEAMIQFNFNGFHLTFVQISLFRIFSHSKSHQNENKNSTQNHWALESVTRNEIKQEYSAVNGTSSIVEKNVKILKVFTY